MNKIVINLNIRVKVVIAKGGPECIEAYYDAIDLPKKYRKTSKVGDVLELQLWDAMAMFGPGLSMGFNNPISTDIELVNLEEFDFLNLESDKVGTYYEAENA